MFPDIVQPLCGFAASSSHQITLLMVTGWRYGNFFSNTHTHTHTYDQTHDAICVRQNDCSVLFHTLTLFILHRLFLTSSSLNPYSYDESCVSSSVDHLPLAALPLLAIVSPRYQDAVATVIARANQVYHSFLQSEDGQGFAGQVRPTMFWIERTESRPLLLQCFSTG